VGRAAASGAPPPAGPREQRNPRSRALCWEMAEEVVEQKETKGYH
jgi:hypothetical protein